MCSRIFQFFNFSFMIRLFNFLFLLTLVATSCKKEDTKNPVITITSPVEGAILDKGANYPITGFVTDDTELAEISVGNIKITTFDSPTRHEIKNIEIPIPATAASGNYNIVVTAKDLAKNEATKVVTYSVR